jgi:hypothetical protein
MFQVIELLFGGREIRGAKFSDLRNAADFCDSIEGYAIVINHEDVVYKNGHKMRRNVV